MATLGDSDFHSTAALLTPRPRSSAQWWGAEELSSRAGLGGPSRGLLRIRSTTLVSKWIHAQRAPLSSRMEAQIFNVAHSCDEAAVTGPVRYAVGDQLTHQWTHTESALTDLGRAGVGCDTRNRLMSHYR